ncbi:MAG: hypothetical protein U1E91_02345 [Moraxella sp.]
MQTIQAVDARWRLGLGARISCSHPADEQGDMVAGFVFSSDDLPNHWARLDEF